MGNTFSKIQMLITVNPENKEIKYNERFSKLGIIIII